MILTHKVTLSLDRRGDRPCVDAVQGDTARAVEISLTANGAAWLVPAGTEAVIRYRRIRGGTGGIYDTMPDGSAAYAMGENAVTVYLAPQVLAVAGPTELQVTLVKDDAELTCFAILLHVQGNLVDVQPDDECYVNLSAHIQSVVEAALGGYVPNGAAGIHVGPEAPEGEGIVLWVDTDENSAPAQGESNTGTGQVNAPDLEWKPLAHVETTEAVWEMALDLVDGEAVSALWEIKLYITFGTFESGSSLVVKIQDTAGAQLISMTHTSILSASVQNRFFGHLDCDGTFISGHINNDWDRLPLKLVKYESFDPDAVKRILINSTATKIPVGTVVEIWGR